MPDFAQAAPRASAEPAAHLDRHLLRLYHEHGDLFARDRLVEHCMPLVYSVARRYCRGGEAMEDLVQVGSVGLVKAIRNYDPSLSQRFVSYAMPTISGEIKRYFRDHGWAVHVPRGVKELHATIDATPTDPHASEPERARAVAAELGLDLREVENAIDAGRNYRSLSLDWMPADHAEETGRKLGRTDPGYEDVERRLTVFAACRELSQEDRKLIWDRFYEERLQREIARDAGVSQMQISRRITRVQERLAAHGETGPQAA